MPIRVALHHKTTYRYDRRVKLSPQVIRLRPAPHCRTPVTAYSLNIEPSGYFINWQQDPQSNYLARVVFPDPVRYFQVVVDLVAEMTVINPFDFFLEPYAEQFPFTYEPSLAEELTPFRVPDPATAKLKAFVDSVDLSPKRTIDFLVGLNQRLLNSTRYVIRLEPGVQTPEETLTLQSGSCRDSAWLLVQIMRHLGLAARFVSGYLIQLKADVKALDGPSGHLPLAASPQPSSAAPVSGGVDPCKVEFFHEMRVTRIHEDPRVTLPYTEEQWQRIEALGHHVDKQLDMSDVRLTMGGEPTFVSITDMEGAEWNTAAVGANKRLLSEEMIDRLRQRFAPGALLHFGQGKWYPGEPLPRWALACYWRLDGQPLWRDTSLFGRAESETKFGPVEAQRFSETLALRLGLDPRYVNTAFEDPDYYTQRERQLPINVDPLDNRLEDEQEGGRVKGVFQRGVETPAGYVLPLERGEGKNGPEWQTGLWTLRGEKLFLVPGDSPVGLRLPLSSLPWVAPEDRPPFHEVDPLAKRGPLPVPARKPPVEPVLALGGEPTERDKKPGIGESAKWVVRRALCVEPRHGRMHVFMPPAERIEDYIDLLTAIEDTAEYLSMPVVIEGYTPPNDPRINVIKVTPDPGVIEVNIHPAHNWAELVEHTNAVYEEAHQCRLGTEKFMLDGRHSGTGGGNHFVLGAATAGDSPFLRRPDLLRSMLAYWLNHPPLSYMFSGLFIGPTSQAPRIDETRADSLYELEIAFSQIPGMGEARVPPWLVDRVFRHLLVDGTGNTHRAEFCIDKLYSPDSGTGRLGLLELRGFEMPPHARMSLTQQLLVRALIAWFWKQPFKRSPVAWGTQLHDMFMLPHFIAGDFREVLDDLNAAGFGFEPAWFAAHFEFRYPVFGHVTYAGITLELRQATEPWYVLGEEPAGGATTRFVDSSVERVQVKVTGLNNDRYVICCNGRRVPLHFTGTQGEWVAGVRYRAWQPPSCLHPTIPVHAPLIFDVVDSWTGRSVGGCTYHVAHPGGRSYDTFPVNANEAESRRTSRFFAFGHTPGPMSVPPLEENPSFPLTLDLRRRPHVSVQNTLEG
jgi:uncharacterized protein (DUF2126 family)